jgi:preprotein translocase subunit Sec61beta
MKLSPSKGAKAGASAGKKRSRNEAEGSAQGSTPPTFPPCPNPNKEWKKSKTKTEILLALVNSGLLREKDMDMWRAAAGDPYPLEKNPDEVPKFTRFVERGLALPASNFFKGLLKYYDIEYLNLNPNGIFHVSIFVHFCETALEINPHWILFRKFFRVKPQQSANDPRVVVGAGIQMREDAADQYLSYNLIESNQDWKAKWFDIMNHHPELPKHSGKQPKHRAWFLRPRFLITVINANDRISRSNGQPR